MMRLKNKLTRTHQSSKPGTSPGTVEHTGERLMEDIKISVVDYDNSKKTETTIDEIDQVQPFLDQPTKTWIKVCGLHDVDRLKSVWNYFNLHPLIQEDIVNTSQRPKVEQYENCVFFVLRMFDYDEQEKSIKVEQVSIILGKNYVLSFQETDREHFKPLSERLSIEGSQIRKQNTDYLAYALIDTVVDHYFGIIEYFTNQIEDNENELLDDVDEAILKNIHLLRRKLVFFRKSVSPLRDAINTTIRDESTFISKNTKIYLRDVYDHLIQVIENIENSRDIILGLHDMYMSSVSNRMNEVMMVLTIIATIFIPLTFIAGLYGMNFNPATSPLNMPELNWYWGYPASLAVMAITAIVMIVYFKRKGWL